MPRRLDIHEILLVDEMERRGFYKLRVILIPSKFKLDIKFIRTEQEFLYSYQLYAQAAIVRWDNEPNYPDLENYPHHLHVGDTIVQSPLLGNPENDFEKLFRFIPQYLTEI